MRTVLRALAGFLRPSRQYALLCHKNVALCDFLRSATDHEDRGGTWYRHRDYEDCMLLCTEPDRSAGGHKILRILWNPTVHDRDHNSPPPVPALSQTHLALERPSSFANMMLILTPSRPRSTHHSFLQLSHSLPFHAAYRTPHPSHHLPSPHYNIWRSSLRKYLHSPLTSSIVGPNILPSTRSSMLYSVVYRGGGGVWGDQTPPRTHPPKFWRPSKTVPNSTRCENY